MGNIEKIPPGQKVECRNGCSATATRYREGIPYCNECFVAEQRKAWDNEVSIVTPDGEVVVYEIVQEFNAEEK